MRNFIISEAALSQIHAIANETPTKFGVRILDILQTVQPEPEKQTEPLPEHNAKSALAEELSYTL